MAKTDSLDDALIKLDNQCGFILATISMNEKGFGFNSLLKKIREHDEHKRMAKSTLSIHLKHLEEGNLIENEIVKESPLKYKPAKYKISQHFREISKGMIAQSTTPEDFLPFMRDLDAEALTDQLMKAIHAHVAECLGIMIQVPDEISRWNMHQALYNLRSLMIAYRERIIERKEEIVASTALDKWIPKE